MSSVFPGLELGDEVSEVMHADNCSVLKIENETGEGIMTCYMLFPGVVVMYNDFHMSYCDTSFETDGQQMLCVDHCREGSMERFVRPEVYYYFHRATALLTSADITLDGRTFRRTIFMAYLSDFICRRRVSSL